MLEGEQILFGRDRLIGDEFKVEKISLAYRRSVGRQVDSVTE